MATTPQTRKLPIGVQDFEKLRIDGFLYVDKTEFIQRLASQGKPYFLFRPRRFGKSLFLSTLKAYFVSLDAAYAAVCGITQTELETNFGPEVSAMSAKLGLGETELLARLKKRYDGYHTKTRKSLDFF